MTDADSNGISGSTGRALDLRVVEVGEGIAPAYAGKLLADLGADVVRVEALDGGWLRGHGPFKGDVPDREAGGLHLFLNTNKRSVALDLKGDHGRERLRELAARADVLIHNLPPAEADQLRVDYGSLEVRNSELVLVSLSTFGHDTPRRDWDGTALIATAASGISYRIGDPGREPLWLPYCAADFQLGIHGAIAALMALRSQRATGLGQHAWVSAVDVMATYLNGAAVAPWVYSGRAPGRSGVHMSMFYPWQVTEVADGYFEVITLVDAQWNRFVELMGNPAWAEDERLKNRWLAGQWAEELDAHWHPWMKARTRAELWDLFRANHIAFQPVHRIDEVVESDHLKARAFWQEVEHPTAGTYRTLGAPYRLSESPWALRRSPPLLGQHTDEVIDELPSLPRRRSRERGPGGEGGSLPLRGIRVLDHGHVWAGPLVGLTFADMGAEVIKVTAPGRTSGVSMGTPRPGVASARAVDPADPLQYHGYDRGKTSITVDLRSAKGRDLYLQLVAVSDVIVENFSPGVMPSLGLSYEELRKVNPAIILASLSAAGATPGPWRDLVTYGPSLAALYGIKSLMGYPDDPCPREDTADLDPTAAGHAVVAILAALEYRERTGLGQFIEMAQGEATIQRIAEPVMDYLLNGRVAGTQGNRYPGQAPHGYYPAAGEDAWVAIACRDQRDWQALLGVVGADAPGLRDERFATLERRLAGQDELDSAMGDWTARFGAWELSRRLQAAGVPAHPVMGPQLLAEDENYQALRQAHIVMGPGAKVGIEQVYQGVPWKLTKAPGVIRGPQPATGSGNSRVFGELLGLDDAELERLHEDGVI